LIGDIHGEWQSLYKKIEHNKLKDCLMIQVGDLGAGFHGGLDRDFTKRNRWFKSRNIEFLAIRGNHDSPAYFDGHVNFSNFKLLKDYTQLKINNELWLFVGGAVSVDRKAIDSYGDPYRLEGRSWWKDEIFVLDESRAVRCDVLVTHTCPQWTGPNVKSQFVAGYFDRDVHLLHDLNEERRLVTILYDDLCRPKKAFQGHMHRSEWIKHHTHNYECDSRILDILEFAEYR
jgi:hypothetical protein